MRAKPRKSAAPGANVRRGIAAALAACGVAGGGAAAAWALQAAALPRPAPGKLVAARAMSWLTGNRVVESTFVIGAGRPVHSRCVRTRLSVGGGRLETAVLLELDGRRSVVAVGPPYLAIRGAQGEPPAGLARARLALAGCAPVLQSMIAALVKFHATVTPGRDHLAGRAVRTLRIWTKAGRLTVYLDETSKRPLAVTLVGDHVVGRARLRLLRDGA
jgi:hypothetical protein